MSTTTPTGPAPGSTPDGAGPVHVPPPSDRGPKTRRRLLFFDRAKVLVAIAAVLGFLVAKYHAEIPVISWGEAAGEQLRAKGWMLWLAGAEVIRQAHYLISERSGSYHHFWSNRVFGSWERFWGRRNPWLRFRLARFTKAVALLALADLVLAGLWGLDPFETAVQAPLRIWNALFGTASGLPFIIQIVLMLVISVGQFAAIFWFMSRGGVDTYLPDEVDTRFSDVWGQDKVVAKVRENLVFLEHPEEIEAKGGHVPSGILLWGPPGTGKTLIAKAVAGETGRPFVFVDPGAFQNMFFGVGILKVKALFRKLRKLALRHGGVIAFFDEADSLGNRGIQVAGRASQAQRSEQGSEQGPQQRWQPPACNGRSYASAASRSLLARSEQPSPAPTRLSELPGIRGIVATGLGGGAGMGTLQALLTEISGLDKPRGFLSRRLRSFLTMPAKRPPKYRILIMMATNAPDALDEALRRPGRLDREYKVDYPTLDGRIRTYEGYLDRVKHSLTAHNVERLALMSPNASGAKIKDIVNESLIVALADHRDTVTWSDVIKARSVKTYGLPDDVHPVVLERHHVALHEAGHAVAMHRLQPRSTIDIATIEPRAGVGGFVAPVPLEEPSIPWRRHTEHDVISFLASLASERHFYDGDNSAGVSADLASATMLVRRMEGQVAMGATIHSSSSLDTGDATKATFDARAEQRLRELYDRAVALIEENEVLVMAVAHALERHYTITGEDIDAIERGVQGPTVDGSWYRSPEFDFAYRRYHEAAVHAHVQERKLEHSFPMPGMLEGVGSHAGLTAGASQEIDGP